MMVQDEIKEASDAADRAARKAKALVRTALASLGGVIYNAADIIATFGQHALGVLPSVQAYLKVEWVQYIGLAITGSILSKALVDTILARMKANQTQKAVDETVKQEKNNE